MMSPEEKEEEEEVLMFTDVSFIIYKPKILILIIITIDLIDS